MFRRYFRVCLSRDRSAEFDDHDPSETPRPSQLTADRPSHYASGHASQIATVHSNFKLSSDRIKHSEKTGVCNLEKQNITQFPEGLQKLTGNLRSLDLSENKIPALPDYIGAFQQLKILNIAGNRLASLPAEFGGLIKLETLHADRNRLTALPPTLSKLKSLKEASFSDNVLRVFPVQLCGLKSLDMLNLSHNKLTDVPDDVKDLAAVELNLNQNQINRLSEKVAECPRLKVLRLEENCLELSSISPRLLRDSQVALIAVEGNVFDQKQFRTIDGYDQYMERYTATKKKFN